MSFDVELICLKNGEPDTFPAQIVRDAFERFIKSREEDVWILAFPDGGGGEMVAEDEEAGETNGVSIGSPSGDNIYDALYEVLRQTNSVMTWSFGGCAVANASVIADLPKELIEENGKPIIVGSGWEILAAIEAY
ncbi:MAG TPA: hypothetical protein VL899_11270 [Alphaproteobacteria bacterium]|nr:hypothetical protein [Alphaproteobacteria bacterium]